MAAMETSNKELTNTGQDEGPDSSRHPTNQETTEDIRPMQETQSSKPLKSAVEEKYAAMVTENATHDPAPLSQINNMGRKYEITESAATAAKSYELSVDKSAQLADTKVVSTHPEIPVIVPRRTTAEVQRELLGLKRKALKLRRQGEVEEAEEVQKMAKALEVQLEELTTPNECILPDTSRDDKLENVGSMMCQEKLGNLNSVAEVARQSKLLDGSNDESSGLLGLDWIGSSIKQPFQQSSSSVAHEISKPIGDMAPLLEVFNSGVDTKVDKSVDPFAQSGQLTDFGNDWRNSLFAVEERGDQGSSSSGNISYDSSSSKPANNPRIGSGKKSEILLEKEEKTVGMTQRTQADETNQTSLQQEILARKRKAVSLKREGKLAEAREELRQAKLLEKGLQEERSPPPVAASTELHISNNDISIRKEAHKNAGQASKPLTSRDRFKLQQESLAHKRQAMKLRREGRTDEADAEFQLAKALEAQLEESASSKAVSEADGTDDLGVEEFLDPQLLSALKAIGLHDDEVVPKVSAAPESVKPTTNKNEPSNQERTQLEELIKAEKVKAVNLKRAGKQSEALDALRRAKMHEKKLYSLFPQ
ncbi:hypothetical protein Scep_013151 [Stephania cephalantha]|uniref:Uncharacterized protein n=1 Tax=Stephania cephalantha TaxID=152367 RepID=A0AAP0JIB1_9MAGN